MVFFYPMPAILPDALLSIHHGFDAEWMPRRDAGDARKRGESSEEWIERGAKHAKVAQYKIARVCFTTCTNAVPLRAALVLNYSLRTCCNKHTRRWSALESRKVARRVILCCL